MSDRRFEDSWAQSAPGELREEEQPRAERRRVTVSLDDLERALTGAVRIGIKEAMRNATSEESVKAFWRRGFEEMSSHGTAKMRDGVGGAVLKWGAGILATAGLALWLRFGPWK